MRDSRLLLLAMMLVGGLTAASALADETLLLANSTLCDEACDCLALDEKLSCDSLTCDCPSCRSSEMGCVDRFLPRSNLCLPIFKDEAEAISGVTLPLPIGVSYINTLMDRNVRVEQVRIGLGDQLPTPVDRVVVDDFVSHAKTNIFRGDLWILPCLNVYGIAGRTNSSGDLTVQLNRFPFPNSPPIDIPIRFELDGPTFGAGATAAIGTKHVFASLDVNYTKTDFEQLTSEVTALVVSPRFGVIIDQPCYQGEFHIGVMYQDTAQTIDVLVESGVLGPIRVEVDQIEPRPWNFLVGTLWAIDERLHAVVEVGVGGREYVISGLTLRF